MTLAVCACLAGPPTMASAGVDFACLAQALEALQDELKCSIWCGCCLCASVSPCAHTQRC